MLAAVAGAMRAYLIRHGEQPVALKAMVPVSVRSSGDVLGNHISFVFAELPCDEPDPLIRLQPRARHDEPAQARRRARRSRPCAEGRRSHAGAGAADPVTFHREPAHVQPRGVEHPRAGGAAVHARLSAQATYPVVPLADRHALSVGITTVRDLACFGVYADREALPDADGLAHDIDEAIAELLAGAR